MASLALPRPVTPADVFQLLKAGLAGAAATLVDLAVLSALVSGFHQSARLASIPALVAGGVANFFGNRHFAFRAERGSLLRQAALYTLVELLALALNGLLFDTVLRAYPSAAHAYVVVRLVTSHVVFLCWSYPLWTRVFAVGARSPLLLDLRSGAHDAADASLPRTVSRGP